MRLACSFLLLFTACFHAFAAEPTRSVWNGADRLDFAFEDTTATLLVPKTPAAHRPWIWRTEFFGHEPQADLALCAAGWHVAYVKVNDQYGAPVAIEKMGRFREAMVQQHQLGKVVMEGFSRGGLYAVNYAAAHPDHVAALYLDAPVLDLWSWPGSFGQSKAKNPQLWQQACALYGITAATPRQGFPGNPMEKAEVLAKARLPILAVCGEADDVVPLSENTFLFRDRVQTAGGTMEVMLKPGIGHHPHSFPDPKPIVEFLLRVAQ